MISLSGGLCRSGKHSETVADGSVTGFALLCCGTEFSPPRNGRCTPPLQPGLYGNSRLYEALGLQYILHIRNISMARCLRSTGMNICSAAYLTAHGVMRVARNNDRMVRWMNAGKPFLDL